MFTWRHLLWLAICAGMVTCTVAAFRRKRPSLSRVLTTAMIISVLSEIVKIGSVIEMVPSASGVITGPYIPMNHLPLHFCSLQIIMIFIAKTTEDEKKRESLLSRAVWQDLRLHPVQQPSPIRYRLLRHRASI